MNSNELWGTGVALAVVGQLIGQFRNRAVKTKNSSLDEGGLKSMNNKIWVPQLVAIIMLLWAFNRDNPYSYYILLRWVCCGVFAYLAYKEFELGNQGWTWMLGITAGIFNPIFPVHLTRSIWAVADTVAIGISFASIFSLRNRVDPAA